MSINDYAKASNTTTTQAAPCMYCGQLIFDVQFMERPAHERCEKHAQEKALEESRLATMPTITLAPGAFDDLPIVPLVEFLHDHGLILDGLTIRRMK